MLNADSSKTLDKNRIDWIDRAKAIGIVLVYYGHIVEELANNGSAIAFTQFKGIYAFHMPLFFIMAGFFFKRREVSTSKEIILRFYHRIVPVFTFGLLTLPLWPVYLYATRGSIDWHQIGLKAYHYLRGQPDLNTITWFIVCLFTTEVIAIGFLSRVEKRRWGLIIAAVFLYFGLHMTLNIRATVTSLGIPKNTWYIHEALVAFGLYAFGFSSFVVIKKIAAQPWAFRLLLAIVGLVVTLTTFNGNAPYQGFAVIMKNSNHGESLWFILTALSGSFFILMLSTLVTDSKIMKMVGSRTLILVATSGVFHEFINPWVVKQITRLDSWLWITVSSAGVAILSMAASLPVAWFLDRYLPQLVGRPLVQGPWLPNIDSFVRAKLRRLFKRQAE
jgi:fucose 4-O-acetylase-like acetyltransferase